MRGFQAWSSTTTGAVLRHDVTADVSRGARASSSCSSSVARARAPDRGRTSVRVASGGGRLALDCGATSADGANCGGDGLVTSIATLTDRGGGGGVASRHVSASDAIDRASASAIGDDRVIDDDGRPTLTFVLANESAIGVWSDEGSRACARKTRSH